MQAALRLAVFFFAAPLALLVRNLLLHLAIALLRSAAVFVVLGVGGVEVTGVGVGVTIGGTTGLGGGSTVRVSLAPPVPTVTLTT